MFRVPGKLHETPAFYFLRSLSEVLDSQSGRIVGGDIYMEWNLQRSSESNGSEWKRVGGYNESPQ